ncbi:MAG: hypothetical protein JRM79_01780 [Nitrososphaerota archaeon]|nr:hypothetical protein [Nitrososphaerota archaeon]MCL5672203.1 hypothetical protein [Nitrososphaerota archaeon]MDG6903525.1 hypothetical protein [Nitrososphaerota archaeon]MDG6912112.1 hypothetical protein [Nitrososphaerota archaeon]MDG6924732.1 hypothetical protein [Nitrososphaerota archaeon]
MSEGASVRDYLRQLERTKARKDGQVKEGLETFIGLWEKAIENRVVGETDSVEAALAKLEKAGGLYRAAGA